MAARVSKPTQFMHVRQLAVAEGQVTVTCSHARCDFTASTPVSPTGAQAAFAIFNRHLVSVSA